LSKNPADSAWVSVKRKLTSTKDGKTKLRRVWTGLIGSNWELTLEERNWSLEGFEQVYIGTPQQVLHLAFLRDYIDPEGSEANKILAEMQKLK